MRVLAFVLGLMHAVSALAQGPVEVHNAPGAKPYTNNNVRDSGDKFQFAIMTDRTGGMRPGIFELGVEKMNLLQPAFVMSVGDLIEGGADRDGLLAQWDEFDAIIDNLEMPFFYVPGNHDVSNSADGRSLWEERVGPLYYHFLYKDVLFLVMNSDDDTLVKLGNAQIAYAKETLEANPEVRWTFVFFHKPLWDAPDSRWDEVEVLLKYRPHTVFSGHRHNYMKYERHTRDYFVLGTTGGGSSHEGLQTGSIDHVVWVTVDEGEPQIANLLLEGVHDRNLRTDWSAALGGPLLRGLATPEVQAWLQDDEDTINTAIPVRNPLEVPIEVTGVLRPTDHLSPAPGQFKVALDPGESTTVSVQLQALQDVLPEHMQAMVIDYGFVVHAPEKPSVMFSTKSRIYFDTEFAVARISGEVAMDGHLDELPLLPIRCTTPLLARPNSPEWRNAGDASFEFGIARTREHLYLAVRVYDDLAQVSEHYRPHRQDGVEIRLDARPETEATAIAADEEKAQSQYLVIAANPLGPEGRIADAENLPSGTQFVCVPVSDGYVIEGLVPLAYLEELQGRQWSSVRLNVAVHDYDALSDSGVTLWWRPGWNGADTPVTSGRFYR